MRQDPGCEGVGVWVMETPKGEEWIQVSCCKPRRGKHWPVWCWRDGEVMVAPPHLMENVLCGSAFLPWRGGGAQETAPQSQKLCTPGASCPGG